MSREFKDLTERDNQTIWHPYTQVKLEGPPLSIKEAKDALLIDCHGNTYIDAISSWWVNLHGHANQKISEAIYETAKILDQVIFAGFTHEPAVLLAENLLRFTGLKDGRVFFSDDGSTAVEAALKMAIQYHYNMGNKRKTVIALEGAYHGDTFGSMSVSAKSTFNSPFENYLFDVKYIKRPDAEHVQDSIYQLQEIFEQNSACAFIYEPLVQGAGGMNIYPAENLDKLLRICRDKKVICIADEVFTGFGRTGRMLASDYCKEKPDIYCLSKGITGGVLPLGATVAAGYIYKAFLEGGREKMLMHGHSYTANPLSCAAANASFDLLNSDDTLCKIKSISEFNLNFVSDLSEYPKASNPRCLGTIMAYDFVSEDAGYLSNIRDRLYKFYLENGVLLRPLGNTVYIVPPYCITKSELESVYRVIRRSLNEM